MKKLLLGFILLASIPTFASEKWTCAAKCGFDTGQRFSMEGSYQQRVFSTYKTAEGLSLSEAFNNLVDVCQMLKAEDITKKLAPDDKWVKVVERYLNHKSNPVELFSKYEEVRRKWTSDFNYTVADINNCKKH